MANRDEYIAKMKAQLDEWNADLGKLEDKMEAASDATKERMAPYLENMRDARDAATKKLGELKAVRGESLVTDFQESQRGRGGDVEFYHGAGGRPGPSSA